jgi:hypothetical protein
MTPDLALAIPLVQVKHDVTVKFPVLINATTVIKPGMVLRNVYLPPTNDDSNNLALAHEGTLEESYSRSPAQGNGAAPLPPAIAHELERQRRIVWEVPVNFQLALAQLPTDMVHLIYSITGDNRNLDDQRFNFFDGLFLGSPSPGIFVLGVETGSEADKAGIKAGDQLLSLSGTALPADLAAFPALFFAARKDAADSHAAGFPVVVRSPGESGTHTASLPAPPTIKSMLMQGL